jgi:hypothetical protein
MPLVYAMSSKVQYKGKGEPSSIMVNPMLKLQQIVCSNPVEMDSFGLRKINVG